MNDAAQYLASHGGPVLFAIVFAEQAGLPLPSAPWLLAAGALSASGKLSPAAAIATAALACVSADWIWFHIGRRGGTRVLRLFCRVSLSPHSCVERTRGLFASRGLQGLALAKFIPVLGTVMPPLAGAIGMRTGRFLLFDGLGSVMYAGFYVLAGLVFHNELEQALTMLNKLGLSALLLGLLLAGGYIAFKYLRRRGPLTALAPQERPGTRLADLAGPSPSATSVATDRSADPPSAEASPASPLTASAPCRL